MTYDKMILPFTYKPGDSYVLFALNSCDTRCDVRAATKKPNGKTHPFPSYNKAERTNTHAPFHSLCYMVWPNISLREEFKETPFITLACTKRPHNRAEHNSVLIS